MLIKFFYISGVCIIIICLSLLPGCKRTCQAGYENPNCSIETRALYENLNYTAVEHRNQDSAYSYPAVILPRPGAITQVLISNLGNGAFGHSVIGTVSGDTLTIAYQNPDSNASYIQGSGQLYSNALTFSFAISYPDSLPVLHTQTDMYESVWTHP